MITVWPHSKVKQDLTLTVTTDRQAYKRRQPVMLTISLGNTGPDTYDLPPALMNRSAHVLFLERKGRGLFAIALSTLFRGHKRLTLKPGESMQASFLLHPRDISEKTAVEHYQFPVGKRTFQLFLPLAKEDAVAYKNTIAFNVDEITVADSWSTDDTLLLPPFIAWLIRWLRVVFMPKK